MRKERCDKCYYRDHHCYCHRFPPTTINDRGTFVCFPAVNDDHWCGEFRLGKGGDYEPPMTWEEDQ